MRSDDLQEGMEVVVRQDVPAVVAQYAGAAGRIVHVWRRTISSRPAAHVLLPDYGRHETFVAEELDRKGEEERG